MDNFVVINLSESISVTVYTDREIFFNEPVQVLDWDDIKKINDAVEGFRK